MCYHIADLLKSGYFKIWTVDSGLVSLCSELPLSQIKTRSFETSYCRELRNQRKQKERHDIKSRERNFEVKDVFVRNYHHGDKWLPCVIQQKTFICAIFSIMRHSMSYLHLNI